MSRITLVALPFDIMYYFVILVSTRFGSTFKEAVSKPKGEQIMYIHVYTDEKGQIIATSRPPQETSTDGPHVEIHPEPGLQVYQIELTDQLVNSKSADELHQELAKLIPQIITDVAPGTTG